MAHKEPHVAHSPEPRVALCEPCVARREPGVTSGTDEPRVARSEPCVAQVFLQCILLNVIFARFYQIFLEKPDSGSSKPDT